MSCACWNYLLHWSINTLGTGLYFIITTLPMCLLLYFKSINNSGAAAEIRTKHTERFTPRFFSTQKGRGKPPLGWYFFQMLLTSTLPGVQVPLALLLPPAEGMVAGSGKPPALPTSPRVWGHCARLAGATCHPRAPLGTSRLPSALPLPSQGNLQQHVLQSPGCLFSFQTL